MTGIGGQGVQFAAQVMSRGAIADVAPTVLDLPGEVGVPYDCTLHDYYAICPQYHLNAEDGRYCGEPDALGCAACLARRPGQWGMDITAWRGARLMLIAVPHAPAPSTASFIHPRPD